MSNVLVRLGDPRAQAPGEFQLLHQVSSQTRTVLRAKRNSGNPWNFADTQVETQPDESLYQITATDCGLPLAVLTVDDYNNMAFVCRRIPMYIAADFHTLDYGLPSGAGSWWAGSTLSAGDPNHAATRCNITWRDNVPYIEFIPVGNQSATYVIRYLQSADGVVNMALATNPVPAEDADLIEIRAAKSLLPLTQWEGNNEAANTAMQNKLRISLTDDERLAFEQFNAANMVTSGPSVKPRWSGSVVG